MARLVGHGQDLVLDVHDLQVVLFLDRDPLAVESGTFVVGASAVDKPAIVVRP